jgi:hypothetical protein
MKMTPESNGQVEPLCTFGPGGDFVAHWQPERKEIFEWSNPLLRFLAGTVEIVVVIFGLRRSEAFVHPESTTSLGEITGCRKENIVNAVQNSQARDTTDPSPTPAFEDGSVLSGEPLLFPDLKRDGVRIEPKPKHRLRAYHRAAKKRSTLRLAQQGTLFDFDFASAQMA